VGTLKEDLLLPGVELRETHISWVFLTETEAWKVKKPVSLGFLDFGTPEKRRLACEAELRLNRRLSPEVYLGVLPVVRDESGRHRLGGDGAPVDWAVHMRRLPDSDRFDVRLSEGRLRSSDLERVAARLARFHRECGTGVEAARYGSVPAIRFNVQENFDQTKATIRDYLGAEQVEELESWQLRFLEEKAALFDERIRKGRVRDGHGDLRLEHLYFGDRGAIEVLDCIEFNDRLRFADVCADVVFLAMDLSWRGHVDLAEQFLACYASEADDFDLYPVVDFYESYRAFVRGKISSMVALDPEAGSGTRERAREEARRYFLLALASERRPLEPPMVIAVGGVIASGKSTIARNLALERSAPVVENDRTRKFLLGVEKTRALLEPAWQGSYSEELTDEVYRELLRRGGAVLASGRTVILDASFRSRAHRREARRLAETHGVPFLFLECRAPEALCRERLRSREGEPSVSDARAAIFDDFVRRWEPVDEIESAEHVVLDTSRSLEESLSAVRKSRAFSLNRCER
jgi:aminoglycoside phosphotransferase family enzyme/predicted kinase